MVGRMSLDLSVFDFVRNGKGATPQTWANFT